MDKSFREKLYDFVIQSVNDKPHIFGSDEGNAFIMKHYMDEHHQGEKVEALNKLVYSAISTVSRFKNKYLKQHPELDFRVKFKPRKKGLS